MAVERAARRERVAAMSPAELADHRAHQRQMAVHETRSAGNKMEVDGRRAGSPTGPVPRVARMSKEAQGGRPWCGGPR